MRNTGIEIHFINGTVPESIKNTYDIEWSSCENTEMLWVHSDGFKEINIDVYDYVHKVTKVYNRSTQTDHLNLFIESSDIDQYSLFFNEKAYKNVTWSEISTGVININDTLLKREVLNL